MDITISIPDEQWQEFQELSQENVDKLWNGNHKDFATYIMTVNLENYIASRKKKRDKEYQSALRRETERMKKEQQRHE